MTAAVTRPSHPPHGKAAAPFETAGAVATPPDALTDAPADAWAVPLLDGFYRWHARVYDGTRPFLLFGRRRALRALAPLPGERVLDVGCGTGWSLPRLHARGARPIGIECSAPMRRQAERRLRRHGLADAVPLDPRPYGSHAGYAGGADGILLSYSLSMVPPYERVLERAREDLRPGGRIAVVDFRDAWGPVGVGLRRSHVFLGPERLATLRRLFPQHRVRLRSTGLWQYFVFVAER